MLKPDDFTVTISDVRAAGFCTRGARAWFDARGVGFREFLKHGVSASYMLATEDPHAARIVEFGRTRVSKESGHG